jgi:hypothetical protein
MLDTLDGGGASSALSVAEEMIDGRELMQTNNIL